MKLRSHRENLLAAFQLASVAVPTRDVKPVLRNLKAIAEKDRLTLLATDLELGIRLVVRGIEVEEAGEALLPAQRVQLILRESTDSELTIEANEQTCIIRGGQNEFEMGGENPADFPDVPAFSGDDYHELAGGPLREMIKRTVFATATENPRYALTGVLWELEGEQARLVATDGRRLAVASGPAVSRGKHNTKDHPHVVPAKAMQLLERNLQDPDEKILVCLRPNEALFKTERAMIYSRLVEGRFPPYREVFPKKPTAHVSLSAGPFHAAVRQAAIMTDEESKKVVFTFEKQKLTMQAQGAVAGRSKVELPIEFDSKPVKIAFDPKYLTEMLRVLDPDEILNLDLTDGNTAALFRAGEAYSYIVMPLT
jgi:DNA polymerase-3 subunit beta